MLKHFTRLIFPKICAVCDRTVAHNKAVCLKCEKQMPLTNYHLDSENPVMKMFYGRVPFHMATSAYTFNKGSGVQKMIHAFKYKGRKNIGIYTGNILAHQLKNAPHYKDVDIIIPVPLDSKKFKKRGYNQSQIIAESVAKSIDAQVVTSVLLRGVNKGSQTKNSRFKRWQNSSNSFYVNNTQILENKHVMLIDDIITTGATIESCARLLIDIPGIKLSVASLAFTAR